MILEALVGLSLQTKPEDGTWWDANYGYAEFQQYSYALGGQAKLGDFGLRIQDHGIERSHYVDQSGIHFDGRQHPVGGYLTWQPGKEGPLFGVGLDKANFRMQAGPYSVGNDHWEPSFMAGVRVGSVELSAAYVYVGVKGQESYNNFPNLGKFAFAVQYAF